MWANVRAVASTKQNLLTLFQLKVTATAFKLRQAGTELQTHTDAGKEFNTPSYFQIRKHWLREGN